MHASAGAASPSAGYAAAIHQAAPELSAGTPEALLPRAGDGFALAFLLAALRPDAARWLGREKLAKLALPLRMRPQRLAAMLDTAPPVPALSETGGWSGLRVPLRGETGEVSWIDLSWRPDRNATGRCQDQGAFALRLGLPPHGRIEVRGRLEDTRLDAVMEVQNAVPQAIVADINERFGELLRRLGLDGAVTVRNGTKPRRT